MEDGRKIIRDGRSRGGGPRCFGRESQSRFDPNLVILRLGFDRAIDISGLAAGQLIVNDHDTDTQYGGQVSGVLIDPTTVDVEMMELAAMGFPDTRLTTIGPSGIVAVDDGGTWPGVVDLLLPFP